jgi:hypothetical protein
LGVNVAVGGTATVWTVAVFGRSVDSRQ